MSISVKTVKAGLIAVDNGGSSTGYVTAKGFDSFPSMKGAGRERNLESVHGRHDYIVELNGRIYFCGTLAIDTKFPLQMHTKTKCHPFFDLSILIACHQYGYEENYVVTCVPISMHTPEEKKNIASRLKGTWELTINGQFKEFEIKEVIVAPETVTAFWINKPLGKVRWVDWGSRTVGYGTTLNDGENMRFLDSQSGTFNDKGLEATGVTDYENLVDYVAGRLLAMWDERDTVIHVGGGASIPELVDYFKTYFPNSSVHPYPKLANARGMYLLGKEVFGIA